MPHLTRRFTLLRAPDGTMVTPDAMRAHLRAQRARARAAGEGAHFLTEAEEDEIIDQLRRQTHMEQNVGSVGRTSALLSPGADGFGGIDTFADSQASEIPPTNGFGGTDGFGDWGGSSSNGRSSSTVNNTKSLAESLGDFQPSPNSTHSSFSRGEGSLFSGRSTGRDNTYLRSLAKERIAGSAIANSDGSEQHPDIIEEEREEDEDQGATISLSADQSNDQDDAVGMPGDFTAADRRPSDTVKAVAAPRQQQHLAVPGAMGALEGGQRQSQLLNLSPEAFKRVSTALEEVYGMVSGRVEEGSGDEEPTEESLEDEDDERLDQVLEQGLEAYPQDDPNLQEFVRSPNSRHVFINRTERRSVDSDDRSFASAHSNVAASAIHADTQNWGRDGVGRPVHDFSGAWTSDPVLSRLGPADLASSSRSQQPSLHVESIDRRGGTTPTPRSNASDRVSAVSDARSSAFSGLAYDADEPGDLTPGRTRSIPKAGSSRLDASAFPPVGSRSSGNGYVDHSGSGHTSPERRNNTALTGRERSNSSPSGRAGGGGVMSYAPNSRSHGSNNISIDAAHGRVKVSPNQAGAHNYLARLGNDPSSLASLTGSARSMSPGQPSREGADFASSTAELRPLSPPQMPPRLADLRRPSETSVATTNASGSGTSTPVLSANAIAARSQRYFPRSNSSARSHADGFRPAPSSVAAVVSRSPLATEQATRQRAGSTPSKALQNITQTPAPPFGDQLLPPRPAGDRFWSSSSSDAASVVSTASEMPHFDDEPDADPDDVWARVTRSDGRRHDRDAGAEAMRPISVLPPEAAASQLADAGFNVGQLAELQQKLVRSASQKESKGVQRAPSQGAANNATQAAPPLPTSTPARNGPQHSTPPSMSNAFALNGYDNKPPAEQERDLSPSIRPLSPSSSNPKLDKARERARMLAERNQGSLSSRSSERDLSKARGRPSEDTQESSFALGSMRSEDRGFATPEQKVYSSNDRALPSVTHSGSQRSFKSQVMYDVTTSHRPTSPPPRTSLSTLPTLQDLALNNSYYSPTFQPIPAVVDPNRQSLSLSSVVENAAARAGRDWHGSQDSTSSFHKGYDGFAGFPGASAAASLNAHALAIPEESGDQEWASGHEQAANVSLPDGDGLQSPVSQAYEVPTQNGHAAPHMPEVQANTWSDTGNDSVTRSVDNNLVDDVEAQARAATLALKGTDDPGPRVAVPQRAKSLSKRKSKKLAKYISQPQLIQTSQKMEHAASIPHPDATLTRDAGNALATSPSASSNARSPIPAFNREERARAPLLSPGGTDYSRDSFLRQEAAGGTRQAESSAVSKSPASSFGSPAVLPTGPKSAPATSSSAQTRIGSASNAQSASDLFDNPAKPAPQRSGSGFSKLMSRVRSRKQSTGPMMTTPIDPYPATTPSPGVSSSQGPSKTGPQSVASQPTASKVQSGASPKSHKALEPVPSNKAEDVRAPQTQAAVGSARDIAVQLPEASARSVVELTPRLEETKSSSSALSERKKAGLLGSPAHIQDAWGQQAFEQPDAQLSDLAQAVLQQSNLSEPQDSVQATPRNDKRKSARDTVVRRTIIVATGADLSRLSADERRKSIISTASRRKSRRPGFGDESIPLPTDWQNYAAGSSEHLRASDDVSSKVEPGELRGLPSPLPRNNTSSLLPPVSPGRGPQSASRSSYHGSLYDMYIDDDETPQAGSIRFPASAGLQPPPSANSYVAEPRGGHIEVTERADGSVVWQVIAGLTDRASTYSAMSGGFVGGHSRAASDTSQLSFRPPRDSMVDDSTPDPQPRTFTGLTSDDSRSFFARSRGGKEHRKSFSFDASIPLPPLPTTMAKSRTARSSTDPNNSTTDEALEGGPHDMPPLPVPEGAAQPRVSTSASRPEQLGFDMANTAPGEGATRIVYTDDADLAAIIEAMSRGGDAAKFEFSRVPGSAAFQGFLDASDHPSRPVSTWTGASADSGEARTHRMKIEAEIFNLLQTDGDLRASTD
ncbi:hypothetical protein IE81DRAFT_105118 [Ceraceosorus guamensis]|uniref:Uncharacterized protein n=1 Tax=Ceraceosorus guamensis TaxID=1522189 RepID=A0A316W019_9BASI|nr:hypothetical protein IE81DRAFT_105118 [Ceraceosorus guamensis]PWN43120.1 hypothetical protein IE81DRAFT_105118 [Ceraceosorus guamensis]